MDGQWSNALGRHSPYNLHTEFFGECPSSLDFSIMSTDMQQLPIDYIAVKFGFGDTMICYGDSHIIAHIIGACDCCGQ